MPTRLDAPPPLAVPDVGDFWRTPGNAQPDDVLDHTEAVYRRGRTGIAVNNLFTPTSWLDVAATTRTQTHTPNANTAAYLTANAFGYSRNSDFVPAADTAIAALKLRHSNGTQGLSFGYNGIQHESRNTGTVGQVFMLGTNHPNTAHALGWPDFNANGVAVREKVIAVHPEDGERWVERYSANGSVYAEMQIGQANAYRPAADQRQAFFDLILAQTGASYGMRTALRIAPTADLGLPGSRNGYQTFAHYLQPTDRFGALATAVFWQENGVLAEGAKVANLWAGIGAVTGTGGAIASMYYTASREGSAHHFIGEPSRATNVAVNPTTAVMESILSLWDDGARSRARFGLGLPRGNARPAGLVSGELWLDQTVPGDPVVRCVP